MLLSGLIAIGALGSFYYFGEHSTFLRVVGLLVALAVITVLMMQTMVGRTTWALVQDSQVELRKVVWPTRKETVQTTLIVMAMVVVIAIFLWILDAGLIWAVRWLTS